MRKRCLVVSGLLCLLLSSCGAKQTVDVQDVQATVAYMDNFTEDLDVQSVGSDTVDAKNVSRIVAEVAYNGAKECSVCDYMVDIDSHMFYEYDPSKGYDVVDMSEERLAKVRNYINKFDYVKNQTVGDIESVEADVKWKIVTYSRDGSIVINQGVCEKYKDVPAYISNIRNIIGGL